MAANSSTALAGNLGKAVVGTNLVLRLTSWTFTPTSSVTEWGDSDSAGFTNRKAARKDGTGSIAGRADTDREMHDLFVPGDNVKLTLWRTTTAGDYYALPCAVITSYSVTLDPDTKEVIAWSADFGCDGQYYYPGESGAPSETLPSS